MKAEGLKLHPSTFDCESKPGFVAGPALPLLHTPLSRPNAWRRYALQKNLVAKVLVASQEILLQTYVAEWPPKPVTNPALLIHGHLRSSNTILGPIQSLNPLPGKPARMRTLFSQTQTCIRGGAGGAANAILDVSPGWQNPELQFLRPHQSCSGNDTTSISYVPSYST